MNVGQELLQDRLGQQLAFGIVEIDQDNVGPFIIWPIIIRCVSTFQNAGGEFGRQWIDGGVPERIARITQPDH